MSGIYIPGMEMPTSCTECWFRKTARHEYLSDCLICPFTGKTTPYTKRRDDCPLVPVPPHGDLIDRSALIENCMKEDSFIAEMLFRKVSNAPTIIPADKEGEP